MDFLLLDHSRQIGFDHRPFHFQRLNIRFFFDGLNGSRFFEFYPRLEKRLCQPRAEAGIGSLPFQRFDLPRAERLQLVRRIHPGKIIRFRQRKDVSAGARHALHFADGLQWFIHPQQKIMAKDKIERSV